VNKVGIIGGGAWGTALAAVARTAGADVLLWAREPEVVEAIERRHENPLFLPDVALDPAIRATGHLAALAATDAWLFVAPAQFARDVLEDLAPHWRGQPLLLCNKGIEIESGLLMTEIAAAALPRAKLAVLSGPTFAAEVARGLPTAVTLASKDRIAAISLIDRLGGPRFRPYFSDDPVGVEVGGAIKNVLAIACGIAQGRGLGDNARAALITRGLAEMARLGAALGARPETFMGLSGLGDLVLTCSSPQSRNMSLGIALGQGRRLDDILAERRSVAEGVATARAAVALAQRLKTDMPICGAVANILYRDAAIDDVMAALLARPFRAELPGLEERAG
jgi:glycerol-3-phosphate dehydrogenase (NAD(P)+)